ncbi:MAG: class I SAM-dependent methyltransferase [Gaiellaceae bacterium]
MNDAIRKLTYYTDGGLKPAIAQRYFRLVAPARTVLDLGCGTGELGRHAPPGTLVHGIDVDPGAVELAARFEKAICLNLNAETLPYDDDTFDAVVAKDVFEHVENPGRVVAEATRVLAPGGNLLASVIMAKPKAVWSDYTHVRGFTKRSAEMLLADAGLEVERIWPMGPVPLASRLDLLDAVPYFLRLPGPSQLWATSWELLAHRPR